MPLPGAYRSRQPPKFENDAWLSAHVLAPTVSASPVLAGEKLQASAELFPAATT